MKVVKAFLCVPMADRRKEDVVTDLKNMKQAVISALDKYDNVTVEFIDNFDDARPDGNTQKAWHIGEAIKKLGDCDVCFYLSTSRKQPGCLTELDYCRYYGIPTYMVRLNVFTGEYVVNI